MDIALLTFLLSLFALVAMILHKTFEEKAGRRLVLDAFRRRADEIAAHWHGSVLEKIEFFTVENLKTVGRLAYVLMFRATRTVRRRANAVYARFHREMSERAVLKGQGAPSFFLKNVADYKDKPAR